MLYNLAIYFYLLGVAIASIFSSKVKKMWRGERKAFDVLKAKVDPAAEYIWVHAASLGEFEQGRPIIERIRATHPEYKILLTFFSLVIRAEKLLFVPFFNILSLTITAIASVASAVPPKRSS